MKFVKVTFVFGALAAFGLGCGSDDKEKTTTTEDGGGGAGTLTLDVPPAQVVGTIMLALDSMEASSLANTGSLWLNDEPVSERDDNCTVKGAPASGGEKLLPDGEDYVMKSAYCLAAFNSVSPDTAPGAMFLARGVSCVAGLEGLYDELEAGESKVAESVDLGESIQDTENDCWGSAAERQAFLENMGDEEGNGGSDLRLQDDDGGMEIKLEVTRLEDSNFEYTILVYMGDEEDAFFQLDLKAGETVLAARGQELDRDTPVAWMVTLDATAGEVRYAGGGSQRVIQIYVKGDVDAESGSIDLSNVEHISALKLELLDEGGGWQEFFSIDGSPSQGFFTNLKYREGDVEQEELEVCLDTASECSDFEKLEYSASAFNTLVSGASDFAQHVATRTEFFEFARTSLTTSLD